MEPRVIRTLLLSAAAAALLTGCAVGGSDENFGPMPITPTEQFAIEVRQTPEEVAIVPSAGGLSAQQAGALAGLAQSWRDGGGDPILVRTPAGGDPRAVQTAAAATVSALTDFGVPADMIQMATYDGRAAGGNGAILVGFDRYQAVGPQCAERWTHVDAVFHARASGAFGCATTANFAAQIANARDIVAPRTETAADAVRRQTQLGLYRQGQPSHATRSNDERTSISDVARQR